MYPMKMRYLSIVTAMSALCAMPVMAQTNTPQAAQDAPTKQKTQGLPPSMANPQYGDSTATKQKSQGVPAALNNTQYGSDWAAKKQQ
jgi:hypothetical protein